MTDAWVVDIKVGRESPSLNTYRYKRAPHRGTLQACGAYQAKRDLNLNPSLILRNSTRTKQEVAMDSLV
jgi:hypothetical protein